MWTISQIAKLEGLSKQGVSKNVGQLIARGLRVERHFRGDVQGVDVAQYFELRGKKFVPVEELRPPSRSFGQSIETLTELIDRLPFQSREIAAAVARQGEAGASTALKAMAFDLRSALLEACRGFQDELGATRRRAG
jgi:hypothetical protein